MKSKAICCIPADRQGNKLWLKELRLDKGRLFVKYKSTYNNTPFTETELFTDESGQNLVITGSDGTALFRFPTAWINNFLEE